MNQNVAVAAEPCAEALRNPLKRYFLATRPPFLLASLAPSLIGLASAAFSGIDIDLTLALLTILGALVFHAAANVLNDVYDAENGTDEVNVQRLYPFTGGSRFIQNQVLTLEQTRHFGLLLMLAGMVIGLLLMWLMPREAVPGIMAIGLLGMLIGWGYSAPPLRLNSRGLGEPSIAAAFGVLIICGADYVQRGGFDPLPLIAAVPFGLLTTVLLYINQFPDHVADAAAGKRHWVVRLGPQRARWGYLLMALSAYGWLVAAVLMGALPGATLAGLLGAPFSLIAARDLIRFAHEPQQLVPAIPLTIVAMLVHGLGVAVGLMWA